MSKDNQVSVRYCFNGKQIIAFPPGIRIKFSDDKGYGSCKNGTNEIYSFEEKFTAEDIGKLKAYDINDKLITNIPCYLQSEEGFEDYSIEKVPDFLKKVADTKDNQVQECLERLEYLPGYNSSAQEDLAIYKDIEDLAGPKEDLDVSKRLERFKSLNPSEMLRDLNFLRKAAPDPHELTDDAGQVGLIGDEKVGQTDDVGIYN